MIGRRCFGLSDVSFVGYVIAVMSNFFLEIINVCGSMTCTLSSKSSSKNELSHMMHVVKSHLTKPLNFACNNFMIPVRVTFDGTLSFRWKCLETCCAVISWDRTDRHLAQWQEMSCTDRRLVQLQSNARLSKNYRSNVVKLWATLIHLTRHVIHCSYKLST